MQATGWEFRYRAAIFGLVIGVPFAAYAVDPQNATAFLANSLARHSAATADLLARLILFAAAFVMAAAAFLRTWASSYLASAVVYASEVKSAALVADGPYRQVRNPLYLANVGMAIAFGLMMSRAGFVLCVAVMLVFDYRLIFREEHSLRATQGEGFLRYCAAVPRLWPALAPRIPGSGAQPQWRAGFQAEFWYWGFAVAILSFAITLRLPVFFAVTTISILTFWLSSAYGERSRKPGIPKRRG